MLSSYFAIYITANVSLIKMESSADKNLCISCQRILACACILPQPCECSHPVQAEETSSTNTEAPLTLQGTKVQYVITSSEIDNVEQPEQCTEHPIHSDRVTDDHHSVPPKLTKVDSRFDVKSHSLEDKFCQLLVKGLPEIKGLRKKLEKQRLQQQIEIEITEYNLKHKELLQDLYKMQLRKAFFKNMEGINE